MSDVLYIVYLSLLQFAAGFGILSLYGIKLKPGLFIPLALMIGVAVFSFVPFLLQLLYIPLTNTAVSLALLAVTALVNIRAKEGLKHFQASLQESRFRIKAYELPFLFIVGFILFVSVWRCFYFPPTPRDLTSGAEVLAEYAIKEKTLLNSLFTVDLQTTNNPFKSPFISSLQIVYKYAGFPFGQIWLSTLFVSLVVFLYHAVRQTVNRLIAWLLLLFFLAIPEMYAYTFIVLFDFPNAVYFFLSFYFLFLYFETGERKAVALAGLLMGIATYTRSETLVLAAMAIPLIVWHHYRNGGKWKKLITANVLFLSSSVLLYLLSVTLYINHYLPVKYEISGLINTNLLNPEPVFTRFKAINYRLIFGSNGLNYYGYLILIFPAYLLVNLAWDSRKNAVQHYWLFAVLIVYFGYPFLGYLLPLLDIDHSTKRGLFKMFPLILLYMSRSQLMMDWSAQLDDWENGKTTTLQKEVEKF